MKVVPLGSLKEQRSIGGVRQSFEIQVKDRPVRTLIATAQTEKDLDGVQSDIEAWLAARHVLNSIAFPKESSLIFPDGDPDSDFSRVFKDRIAEVEKGWKEHHIKVKWLRRMVR